jgi:cyclic pyranopterin phosphate synthase
MSVRDSFGREIHDLRISLTDHCNLRCVYCMPAEGVAFEPSENLLSLEEIVLIARAAAALGVRKIRLTGGEPTVYPHVVDLIRALASIPGISDLSMTTNGLKLQRLAGPLAQAGLRRVNVSLDSLDPDHFRRLTRGGKLQDVLSGLEEAERVGLRPIKVNAVVVRGFNEADVVDLAALTLHRDWEVRFIEIMPFASLAPFASNAYVPNQETMARLEAAFGPLLPLDDGQGDAPARPYRLSGGRGVIGFISPVGRPFCARCGRLRLTANGRLRLCLLRDEEIDLKKPLRQGAGFHEILGLIRQGILYRPWGHDLAHQRVPQERIMSQIGG